MAKMTKEVVVHIKIMPTLETMMDTLGWTLALLFCLPHVMHLHRPLVALPDIQV